MKDASIAKKIIKTINAYRLGILCFSIGKKKICFVIGNAYFLSVNYIRKKVLLTGSVCTPTISLG